MFYSLRIPVALFVLMISACFVYPSSLVLAAGSAEGISQDEALSVQGVVRGISLEDQTMTIKTKTGEKVTVMLTLQTDLVGFSSLDEVVKKQKYKIWYTANGAGDKTAVKVEKMLVVGC